MSDTTPRYGIIEPDADRSDAADIPYYFRQTNAAVERSVMYNQGLFADRPVSTAPNPGKEGRIYYATDNGQIYYDFGTGWVNISLIAHAATHAAGGTDPLKLDDLAAPDDNTDLNVSTTKHGLTPKLPGGTNKFLREDGTYSIPGVTSTTLAGLGSALDGKMGLLRRGASPYSFLSLIYDATYGKWISEEEHISDLIINAAPQDGSSTGPITAGLPYYTYTATGLRWQFKLVGRMYNTYGSTFTNMDVAIYTAAGVEAADLAGGTGASGGGMANMAGYAAGAWGAVETAYSQFGGNSGQVSLIAVPTMFTQNVGGTAYWQGSLWARLAG